jgi:hypothetical protein
VTAGLLALLAAFAQTHEHEHGEGCSCGEAAEADSAGIGMPDIHQHEAGVRNHGTEWFFRQPWSDTVLWGELARDSLVLAGLALAVTAASGRRRR